MIDHTSAMHEEQRAVDLAYRELDRRRDRASAALETLLVQDHDQTPAGRSHRDAEAARLAALRSRLGRVEDRLVFGRVDTTDDTFRVGRLGLASPEGKRLVVDWRADAAGAFYQATAARPGDVRRRRHIELTGRTVTRTTDDLVPVAVDGDESFLYVDAALLTAIEASRTDRMSDVVATLQADQDRIIRSPLAGILIVQGAAGTGKTVVALHRAAYLLHAHRDRLTRRGVLFIGPNNRFLSYVSEVLPGLGEDSVHSSTLAELAGSCLADRGAGPVDPSVNAEAEVAATDGPAAAALKGDLAMAAVLARAVQQWPRVPAAPVSLAVDDDTVFLTPAVVRAAQRAARAIDRPHNQQRDRFCDVVLDDLVQQLAAIGGEVVDDHARRSLLRRLHESADVRREVNLCWMPLTPQAVLRRLWTQPARLQAAAGDLFTAEQLAILHRREGHAWTTGDLVLLAELAYLVGDLPTTREARARRQRDESERREQVRFAEEALASFGVDTGLVDPEQLVNRHYDHPHGRQHGPDGPGATWGHIVVDEAQELTAMAWRLLLRSCPSRSVTAVGDVNQSTTPGAPTDWAEIMGQFDAPWRLEELTVNYRTTATITAFADLLLTQPAPAVALREGVRPRSIRLPHLTSAAVTTALARLLPSTPGSVAIVVPHEGFAGFDRDPLRLAGLRVPVHPPDAVKGLEFDRVVVVEPAAFLRRPRGRQALYVALTRPTQDLLILHSEELPVVLQPGVEPQ
jgi:DNA helicase IV